METVVAGKQYRWRKTTVTVLDQTNISAHIRFPTGDESWVGLTELSPLAAAVPVDAPRPVISEAPVVAPNGADALPYPCDVPGCTRRFGKKMGQTKHKVATHKQPTPRPLDRAEEVTAEPAAVSQNNQSEPSSPPQSNVEHPVPCDMPGCGRTFRTLHSLAMHKSWSHAEKERQRATKQATPEPGYWQGYSDGMQRGMEIAGELLRSARQ